MILKKEKIELTILIILFLSVVISSKVLSLFQNILIQFQEFGGYVSTYHEYLSMMIKMLGLTYLCELVSGICKDYGYSAIGHQVEVVGKMMILVIGIPILQAMVALLEMIL